MKICQFCNCENENGVKKCRSCGGNLFQYKCDNCGTVFSEGVHCPHCGVKAGQKARLCPVCKTEYYSNACPNCGYLPDSGRKEPAAAVRTQPTAVTQPPVRKRRTVLWVLGWIFIFPLPLTLILAKKKDMNKTMKIVLIAAAWIVYLLMGAIGRAADSGEGDPKRMIDEQTESAAAAILTEEPTEMPTEGLTEVPTEALTVTPTKAPAPTEAPVPIVFVNYTDTVEAGANASVTIQGKPNTQYAIHVYYSTAESNAEGLESKTSDQNGYVTWEWMVGTNTTKGEHSITVSGGRATQRVKFTVI